MTSWSPSVVSANSINDLQSLFSEEVAPPTTVSPSVLTLSPTVSPQELTEISPSEAPTVASDGKLTTDEDVFPDIVGGDEVDNISPYRWFAFWEAGCGATLVAPDILLSAAHCVDNTKTRAWIDDKNLAEGTTLTITQQLPHPKFNGPSFGYDFALLKLRDPVTNIEPVTLARTSDAHDPERDDPLTVIGFGLTSESGTQLPSVLREVTVNHVSDSACWPKYDEIRIQYDNEETMLCASAPGKDACFGDSGGPLLDAFGVQVGIVSWGM